GGGPAAADGVLTWCNTMVDGELATYSSPDPTDPHQPSRATDMYCRVPFPRRSPCAITARHQEVRTSPPLHKEIRKAIDEAQSLRLDVRQFSGHTWARSNAPAAPTSRFTRPEPTPSSGPRCPAVDGACTHGRRCRAGSPSTTAPRGPAPTTEKSPRPTTSCERGGY